jgi:hypothetical protein
MSSLRLREITVYTKDVDIDMDGQVYEVHLLFTYYPPQPKYKAWSTDDYYGGYYLVDYRVWPSPPSAAVAEEIAEKAMDIVIKDKLS